MARGTWDNEMARAKEALEDLPDSGFRSVLWGVTGHMVLKNLISNAENAQKRATEDRARTEEGRRQRATWDKDLAAELEAEDLKAAELKEVR